MECVCIPPSVEIIDEWCFTTSRAKHIIFHPESRLKHIGNGAFLNSPIQEITIPRSVETIGNKCISAQKVSLESGSCLKSIQSSTFREDVLNTITLPENCQIIDDDEHDKVYS